MKHHTIKLLILSLALCAVGAVQSVRAQGGNPQEGQGSWYRAEFLKEMDNLERKLIGLAEAVPEEKYTWRPMEGVRSISEVYTHLAKSNLNFAQTFGIKSAPVEGDPEKITEKSKVVELLKRSLASVRQAAEKTPATEWDKKISYQGREAVIREAFLRAAMNMREHLGQSIAYARMNRVVPPWTAEREAQQRK